MNEQNTQIDDGGPAFASVGEGFGNPNYSTPGMTLLDYFAGQVVGSAYVDFLATTNPKHAETRIAKQAYQVAEAMIAEKRRREGGAS